jgi:hypothetical protein
MSTVEVNGGKYNPEDLDCNGNPYKDAVEVFDNDIMERYLRNMSKHYELVRIVTIPLTPVKEKRFDEINKTPIGV